MQYPPSGPAIVSWQTVPARTRLGDCLHVFPIDPEPPSHLDVALDNEALAVHAIAAFLALPPDSPCCLYGSKILIHNPERDGTLETRARHLSHFQDRRTGLYHPDADKCRWLPSIPATLARAAAVLDDPSDGRVIFARKYARWGIHFVVVKPKRSGWVSGEVSGYLITHFGHDEGGRQEALRLLWKRKK